MNKLLIPAFCALVLIACTGRQKPNSNEEIVSTIANSADTISAYEIFKKISPEESEMYKDSDTAGLNFFAFRHVDLENYSAKNVFVQCLKHSNGGTLAVYQSISFDEMGDSYVDFLKFYLYNNGQLTEQTNLLPEPTIDDFAQVDGLTFYNPDQKVIDYFAQKDFRYEYDPETELIVTRVCVFNDDLNLYYMWNGSKFVLAPKCDPETSQNIIHSAGLGNILVGDNPPDEIFGFMKKTEGKTVSFNRKGNKIFELSLNNDGKIDTISVLSPLYTYRIDCDGPTNSHFGVDSKPVDFCFGGTEEFVNMGGVWVRRFLGENVYFCGIMSDSRKADSLCIIDFYTTANAITNLYPEKGKIVKWRDDPTFNNDAAVTLIKIYRRQSAIATDELIDNENETTAL